MWIQSANLLKSGHSKCIAYMNLILIGYRQVDDDFMYMNKKAAICDNEEEVRRIFANFLRHASDLMMQMKVYLPTIKVTWSGHEEEMSEEACRATDIPSFLLALSLHGCVGPYAYESISGMLISFCREEGEKLVADYEEKLECQLRPRVIPTQRKGKKFIVEIDGRLDQNKEIDFRCTLAKLFKCSPKDFLLEDIHSFVRATPHEIAGKLRCKVNEYSF